MRERHEMWHCAILTRGTWRSFGHTRRIGSLQLGLDASCLLHDMREFMREEMPASPALRGIVSSPKHHIAPYRVRQCIDSPRRLSRTFVRMHTDISKVGAKAWFKEGTGGSIERLDVADITDEIIRHVVFRCGCG